MNEPTNSTHMLELFRQLFAGMDHSGIVLLPYQQEQLELMKERDKEDPRTAQ